MNTRNTIIGALGAACFVHVGSLSAADPIRFGDETFELDAGVFLQNFDTKIQVKDNNGSGADVGLEDVLGYDDDDTTTVFGASWRFFSRHREEC